MKSIIFIIRGGSESHECLFLIKKMLIKVTLAKGYSLMKERLIKNENTDNLGYYDKKDRIYCMNLGV